MARKTLKRTDRGRQDKTPIQSSTLRATKRSTDNRSPGHKGVKKSSGRVLEQAEMLAQAASRRVGNRKLGSASTSSRPQTRGRLPWPACSAAVAAEASVSKLYLALLWMAANPPYDVTFPARAWAELLGLPNPEGKGDRRVRDAIDWLADQGLITVTRSPWSPCDDLSTARRWIRGTVSGSGRRPKGSRDSEDR